MSVRNCVDSVGVLVVGTDPDVVGGCTDELDATIEGSVAAVESVGEAMKLLRSGSQVDCVISDHDLPDTDGIAFLEAVRAQYPHLPFILFTSDGSEELASRAISANVTEYLVTDAHTEWDRLAELVTDAIRSSSNREELFESHRRAQTLLDATRDTIVVLQDDDVAYLNESGVDLLGVDRKDEAIGRAVGEVLDVTDDEKLRDHLAAAASGRDGVARLECTLERHGSVHIPIELTATRIEWGGEPAVVLVVRNVSKRKHSEYELERFRHAVEAAGHAIYITDPDGTITYVNPAFERVTGYDRQEAVGQTPKILHSGEMSEEYYDRLWAQIGDGGYWEEEITNRRRSGELYHANQTIAPITDDTGAVEQFVAIQTDITERREAKRDLERYRQIVHHLDDPIGLSDQAGNFVVVNDALAELAGCSREELLGEDESVFLPTDTTATIDQHRAAVLRTEQPLETELRAAPDGETAVYDTRWYPYYDTDDHLAGTLTIWRDITDRIQRQEALKQYERAVTGATDLIAATDETGQFRFANPKYCTYHGIDTEDITEMSLQSLFADREGYDQLRSRVERALDGHTVQYRTTRTHPTRGERTLDVRYYPLSDEGEVTGVVAVLRDVTDRANRAKQLRVVDRVLRHNLRNDLTAIRLRAQQVETASRTEVTNLVAEILDTADGLLTTSEKSRSITDILADPPEVSQQDIGTLLRRRVDSLQDSYPHADIALTGDQSAVASTTQHIGEAVTELLTNSIVHHDGERPRVDVHVVEDADAVRIRLTDDGPGIPPMERDVLVTGTENDELYHGSGLGLWLVYWIVQRSGGSIDTTGTDNSGTDITISLPRQPA